MHATLLTTSGTKTSSLVSGGQLIQVLKIHILSLLLGVLCNNLDCFAMSCLVLEVLVVKMPASSQI